MKRIAVFFLLQIFISACNNNQTNNVTDDNVNPPPPMINFSVVKVYPHDTSSYTQGLQWIDNSLYEGTGNYGHSKIAQVNIETGKPIKQQKIDSAEFGEGIVVLGDTLYQLTWKNNIVNVYDKNSLKKIGEIKWPFEGWGLTTNGKELIISTGSSNIYFVEPHSFKILRQINVTDNNGPVSFLNELEYVDGFIYANVYETNYIVKINAENGNVAGKLDCSNILQQSGMVFNADDYSANTGNVLNGIAYDSVKNSFYITGKLWPALFEIKLN
jgi:glutamine cyclotransferase